MPAIQTVGPALLVIFLAIGLHEYAHAKVADMAGDPTPRSMGRVTLNLFNHFDPVGALMILLTTLSGFGIGWGRPVMVNPMKMRNPRWDHFFSVAAGPLSNVAQSLVWAILFRSFSMFAPNMLGNDFVYNLLVLGVLINLTLAFFNLIPLGPLDGHWLIGAFLHGQTQLKWFMFNRTVGVFLLMFFVLAGQITNGGFDPIGTLIRGPSVVCTRILTGLVPE